MLYTSRCNFNINITYTFHTWKFVMLPVNAWEEGDEIVLYSCRLPRAELTMHLTEIEEDPAQNL